jgi:hypothetical protein
MNKRVFGIFLCVYVLLTTQTNCQQLSRSPQHRNLGYFVGKWKREFHAKPGHFSPGGRFIEIETNKWLFGSTFVVSYWNLTGSTSDGSGVTILGYNSNSKSYTYDTFASSGQAEHGTGTLEGGIWTWTGENTMGDKTVKVRFTMKVLSATAYSFQFDTLGTDGSWSMAGEGAAVRIMNE